MLIQISLKIIKQLETIEIDKSSGGNMNYLFGEEESFHETSVCNTSRLFLVRLGISGCFIASLDKIKAKKQNVN